MPTTESYLDYIALTKEERELYFKKRCQLEV